MKNYILLIPSVLSLVFAFLLFIKAKVKLNRYSMLSGYFFLFLMVLFSMFLVGSFSDSSYSIVNLFSLLFYVGIIGIPPTFYFYVLSLSDLGLKQTKKSILKHYIIPLALLAINLISFFYLKNVEDENSSEVNLLVTYVMTYANFMALLFVFPVQNVIYIYKTIKHYKFHQSKVGDVFSFEKGVDLKWMLHYIIGYVIFIIGLYIIQVYNNEYGVRLTLALYMLLYILFVGIKGLGQEKVFFKEKNEPIDEKLAKNNQLKELILSKTIEEEPYLKNNLTIYEFSKIVGSNSKYVSTILNTEFKQNFVTFINTYRIKKAKEYLKDPVASNYTIEVISEMVGFRSKSAFNKAFKNNVGMTPTEYRKTN